MKNVLLLYKRLMDKVEQLMANRKWVKHCLRTNCAAPEDIRLTGTVKVAKIYSIFYISGRRSRNSTMP